MKRHLTLPPVLFAFATLPASAILDTNGNGLSDLWEEQYKVGPHLSAILDPASDDDGDGWTNAQEDAAGTDPFDPTSPDGLLSPGISHTNPVYSSPEVADPEPVEDPDPLTYVPPPADPNLPPPVLVTHGSVAVTWPTIPGKQYTLLCSLDRCDGPWDALEQPFIGDGSIETFTFVLEENPIKFWRVKVEDVDTDGDGLNNWEEYSLGSNPCLEDTSGDGVPDLWLAVHSFAPTQHHGFTLFPGSSLTVVQAFNAGVQARLTATPNDLDGDGLPNSEDADPVDHTVTWLKSPTPAWLLRFPVVPAGYVFLDVSPAGTAIFKDPISGDFCVITPDLQTREFPNTPPGNSLGFYGNQFSGVLHGDKVLGRRLVVGGIPNETEWAFYDPLNETVISAGIPSNNPPETIYDATAIHVSGIGGGFPMLFGGQRGQFESNDNAFSAGVSLNDGPRYWTFSKGAYDAGRPIPVAYWSILCPSRSATIVQRPTSSPALVHHLMPTTTGLYAAQGNQPFLRTEIPWSSNPPKYWNTWATNQGWLVDEFSGLWWNGNSLPLVNHIPRRHTDGSAIELQQVHTARDTGVIVASGHYPGDTDKFAVLQPINLQVRFPSSETVIPWDEYLPGYEASEPQLCHTATGNQISFINLSATPRSQVIELVFSGQAIALADTIELNIADVSNYSGWSGNAGISTDNDFSFDSSTYLATATAAVSGGQAAVTIYCKDYGAWAKLNVTLSRNCLPIHSNPIQLTLPYDTNGDRIADSWQRHEVRRWNKQFRLKSSDPDWVSPSDPAAWPRVFGTQNTPEDAELADSDGDDGPMPPMADEGDGLNAFEEYRGYFLDGGPEPGAPRHRRLSAARKDLLVECSEMEGIGNTGGSLQVPGFTDPGNDANGFAQAYSLGTVMEKVVAFYASEGPPIQSGADYFPGAAIDMWWVRDTLDDDAANIVYENGSVRSAYKYSGPFYDTQITGQRQAWLSVAWDDKYLQENSQAHKNLYGTGSTGVGILANNGNRNTLCRYFIKLAVQGRKGKRGYLGQLVAPANEAARERDETGQHEPGRPTFQGAGIFVNSLSEEMPGGNPWSNQTAFESCLSWSVAHELGHLVILGRGNPPFDGGEHIAGAGNVMGGTTEITNTRFHEDEIKYTNLRQRASINRDANGNVQP